MCTVFLAYQVVEGFPVVLLSNRDEFYQRASLPMHFWPNSPGLLAGQDLKAKGTWLGLNTLGEWAVVTNYRVPSVERPYTYSRGELPLWALDASLPLGQRRERIRAHAQSFAGFNLLFGTNDGCYYFSNLEGTLKTLSPGIYGLSNHLLDTAWPKVAEGKAFLSGLGTNPVYWSNHVLFELMSRQESYPDHLLPKTGIPLEWERRLSALFIKSETYGTQYSTVLKIPTKGELTAVERHFTGSEGVFEEQSFSFAVGF